MFFAVKGLLNLDAMTYHPKLYLFKPFSPPLLEPLHPSAILDRVWNVNNQAHQIITLKHPSVTPVALNFLSFVAGRAELIHDLQDCLR